MVRSLALEGCTLKTGAVSEASQLAEPVDELQARIAKLVAQVDAMAVTLPKALAKSRLQTLRILAQEVATRSQAIKLAINLDRTVAEVVQTLEEFRATLDRLRIMSASTRMEQGTLLSLLLVEKMAKAFALSCLPGSV